MVNHFLFIVVLKITGIAKRIILQMNILRTTVHTLRLHQRLQNYTRMYP